MPKKLTNEIIDKRLLNRNIRRIGYYGGIYVKIEFECLIDGYTWITTPSSVLKGSGCKQCVGIVPLTNSIVDARLVGTGIRRIGEYIKSREKIEFVCDSGHIWKAEPNSLLQGHGCRICSGYPLLTNSRIDARLVDRDITRIGEYIKSREKIEFLCGRCGNRWFATASNIMRGRGCNSCCKNGFKSDLQSTLYVYNISNTYCGYGITNDIGTRHKVHTASFKKHGVFGELAYTWEMSGLLALKIETLLKRSFVVADSNISSFRKESTSIKNLPKVLDFINEQLKQCQ